MRRTILTAAVSTLLLLFLAACAPATLDQGDVAVEQSSAEPELESPRVEPEPTAIPIETEVEPTAPPAPTAQPTVAPTEPPAEPTAAEVAEEAEEVAESESPEEEVITEIVPEAPYYGRTAEGAFYIGNPNAEITLIDYSDFL